MELSNTIKNAIKQDSFLADIMQKENPTFAQSVNDMTERQYEHGKILCTAFPSVEGMVTVTDQKLWSFLIGQGIVAAEAGKKFVAKSKLNWMISYQRLIMIPMKMLNRHLNDFLAQRSSLLLNKIP